MSNEGRPLSPHLTVYRWPITMTLSILHRLTGVGLSLGLLALVAWLLAAANGPAAYGSVGDFFGTLPGRILLAGWSLAFFYHLANGIRHLVWDAGFGFEKSQANASGWAVIAITLVATIIFWMAL